MHLILLFVLSSKHFFYILCILTMQIQYGDYVDCGCLFEMKAVVGISSPKTVVLNFHVEYD